MAEVLGVAASGISVVSLAIQVAESIKKLRDFCDLMKAAPEEIRLALDEVETLSMIMEDIDREIQGELFLDPRAKAIIMRSYRHCRDSSETLHSLVTELEGSLAKGRKRGSFKIAIKQEKIDNLRKKLEGAKATMTLANQCYDRALHRQHRETYESSQRELVELRFAVTKLTSETSRIASKEPANEEDLDTRIPHTRKPRGAASDDGQISHGSAYPRRLQRRIASRQEGTKLMGLFEVVTSDRGDSTMTSISVTLPRWIYARNFQIELNKSYRGWDQHLRVSRVVPDDADVFWYSKGGNIDGLQRLFDLGQASPWEVDSVGLTPLHYAAVKAEHKTCRFLIENGADTNARSLWSAGRPALHQDIGKCAYSTPLHLLVSGIWFDVHGRRDDAVDSFHETVKALYSGDCDPFLTDPSGQTPFHVFRGPTRSLCWLRQQAETELANLSSQETYELLGRLFDLPWHNSVQLFWETIPRGTITRELTQYVMVSGPLKGYTFLQLVIIWWIRGRTYKPPTTHLNDLIQELILAGSDIHFRRAFRSGRFTPLLLVVREMIRWHVLRERGIPSQHTRSVEHGVKDWLRLLCDAGVDLEEYGKTEINMKHTKEILLWRGTHPFSFTFEVTQLRFGKTPEDFSLEFEDLYFSSYLAADFWLWAEAALEDISRGGSPEGMVRQMKCREHGLKSNFNYQEWRGY